MNLDEHPKIDPETGEVNYAYYAAMTSEERLDLCLEMSSKLYGDPPQRMKMVSFVWNRDGSTVQIYPAPGEPIRYRE
jgi:hypothetical protein